MPVAIGELHACLREGDRGCLTELSEKMLLTADERRYTPIPDLDSRIGVHWRLSAVAFQTASNKAPQPPPLAAPDRMRCSACNWNIRHPWEQGTGDRGQTGNLCNL